MAVGTLMAIVGCLAGLIVPQIDYLLREALRAAGRLPKDARPARPRRGRPRAGS